MKKIFGFLCRLVFAASLGAQDQVSVQFSLEASQAFVGQSLRLTLTVRGSDQVVPPQPGRNADYAMEYSGGGPRNSTSTVSINGQTKTSVERNYQAVWTLKPLRAGRLGVGPFTARVDGREYRSELFPLEVLEPRPVSGFLLTEEVASGRAYPGLPLVYKIKWYFSESVQGPELTVPVLDHPDFRWEEGDPKIPNGADVYQVQAGPRKLTGVKSAEILDGKQYATLEFSLRLLPLKEGVFRFPPAVIGFQGAVSYRQTEDFFGRGIREPVYQNLSIPGKGWEIRVQGLPQAGKPKPFSGLVGEVRLTTALQGREFHVGDPMVFTLGLAGALNMKDVDLNALVMSVFDSQDWRLSEEKKLSDNQSSWILRAARPGLDRIPEMTINYFDPAAGQYRTSTAPSIPILIRDSPALTLDGGALNPATSGDSASAGQSAVRFPIMAARGLAEAEPEIGWLVWWLALLLGPVTCGVLFFSRLRRMDPRRRFRKAFAEFRRATVPLNPDLDREELLQAIEGLRRLEGSTAVEIPPNVKAWTTDWLAVFRQIYFRGQGAAHPDLWRNFKQEVDRFHREERK